MRYLLFVLLVSFALLTAMELYTHKRCACDCDGPKRTQLQQSSRPIPEWEKTLNFTGFNNISGTEDGRYIIPNYVHFIKFRFKTFNLIHMVCVLAAFKHQRPDKLFIHTDVDQFEGKNWETIINTPGMKEVLVVNRISLPTEVFGQPLSSQWAAFHGGDVARLLVMRQFGGIYLDNDSYLIRRVDDLRRYEMVVAWRPGKAMMNQVVLAHKDARLLQIWYDGYKSYKADMWYYNAGRVPALALEREPHLVHSVPVLLGTYDIRLQLYTRYWPEWRTYYSCHLMVRWMNHFRGVRYPEPVSEQDVLAYNNTLLAMVLDVYPLNKRRSHLLYTYFFNSPLSLSLPSHHVTEQGQHVNYRINLIHSKLTPLVL